MCGVIWGSFWWIFPLVGLLVCLTFLFLASRCFGRSSRFMCGGRGRRARFDEEGHTRG
jgi:hypothetical protein